MQKIKSCLSIFVAIFLLSNLTFAQTSKSITSFSKLKTAGNVEVVLKKGSSPAVSYEMIKGNQEDLKIENDGSWLKVAINNGWVGRSNAKAKVTVTYTELNEIAVTAGSKVSNEGKISSKHLEVSSSSGSSATLNLDANEVIASSSSGAHLTLSGETVNTIAKSSSGATLNAHKLQGKDASAHSSSGGSTSVYASKEITASASSGGRVEYSGNPSQKNHSQSSGGMVKQKG